jgi:molybdate transport system substrate-binding protein
MTNPFQKMRRVCAILLVVMALIPIKAEEVEVFAAASLTDALEEIATDYEKETGDKVIFNFAASNTLAVQIKAGAPADVFFSADEAKMDDLEKQNLLVLKSRKDLLTNSLVIIEPNDSQISLKTPGDLVAPEFKKIALGETNSVPAGIYAKWYLQKIKIWDQVAPRVIPCDSVRSTLAAVETGNVDAGIVYYTDALQSKKVKIAYRVSAVEGLAIVYPVAVLLSSSHQVAANRFVEFLDEGDSLLKFEKLGFATDLGPK